jgi:hypothetical protein
VCDTYEKILIKVGMLISNSSSGEDVDWRQCILPCGSQVDLGVCTLLALCKFCLVDRKMTELIVSIYFRDGH